MKRLFVSLVFLASTGTAFSAMTQPHSIRDIPTADESLRRLVSTKFYNSLQISPLNGWVVARGQLVGNRLTASRVVRSDLGGAYDALAVELAENLHILGDTNAGLQGGPRYVQVHLLVYDLTDGQLAVSFANLDEPGGTQWRYYGRAWMAVRKGDEPWVALEPARLARNEHSGPRTYTIAVAQAGARRAPMQPDVLWHRRFAR